MFTGRIDRLSFLLGYIYIYAPIIAFALLYAVLNALFHTPNTGVLRTAMNVGVIILGFYALLLYIPASFGLYVRRLHDLNLTGALSVVLLIPGISLVALLMLLVVPGTKGANDFGYPKTARHYGDIVFGPKYKNPT